MTSPNAEAIARQRRRRARRAVVRATADALAAIERATYNAAVGEVKVPAELSEARGVLARWHAEVAELGA